MIRKFFKTILCLATLLILSQFAYALNIVELSPGYYPNTSRGTPLSTADIYVGKPDLDPEIVGNQKTLSVQQEDGTIVNVTQPIHTNAGGVPQYAGSPVVLLTDGDYSLKVLDSNGSQIYYIPSTAYDQYLIAGNYYYPDYSEADQGVVGGGNTVTDILAEVGATENATMYFSHNSGGNTTTYTFTTNTAITDNFNIIVEEGAILDGAGTLTINGAFKAGIYQVFGSSITIALGPGFIKEVYAQWWGALGDGVQDDQPYIQKAADSMSTGTLRLVGGEYKLNTMHSYTSANTGAENGIIVIDNPISIKGDGAGATKLTVTLDDTFYGTIVLNGVNGSVVEGLYISGTGTAFDSNYGGGIRVLLSGKTVIKNNLFEDLRGIAINYVGNFNSAVGSTGVDYYCAWNVTDGNVIRNVNGDGIYHVYSKYATMANNILYKTGYTDAIILEACNHSTVSNNIILEPNQRAILLNTGSSYSTVTGNTIYHYHAATVYNSIYLASVQYCNISNNVIRYATIGATPKVGISMVPGSQSIIDTYHNISGNILENCGSTVGAIHIQTDYNNIHGNKIDNGTNGIHLDDADYNTVRDNDIHTAAGSCIWIEGIDARPDPTYTYIINNYLPNGIHDPNDCTGTYINGNFPDTEILTTGAPTLSRYLGSAKIDSSGGAITGILGSGYYVGQIKTIVMTDATTSSTISITNHQTSDPEVATFDAVDETGVFMWTGTEWITIFATCTFV